MKYLDNLDIDLDEKMLILNHLFQFVLLYGKNYYYLYYII